MWQIRLNRLHFSSAALCFLGIFSLWPLPLIQRKLFLNLYTSEQKQKQKISSSDRFASLNEKQCTSCFHTFDFSFSSASPWTAGSHWACLDCRYWEATGAAIASWPIGDVDATVILSTLCFWKALVTVSTFSNVCRPQKYFLVLNIFKGNPQTYVF